MTNFVLLLMVFAFFLQSVFAFFQIVAYRNALREMKGKGVLGIGSQRGGVFKKGEIFIVSYDRNADCVNDCRYMRGIASLQRFSTAHEYIGLDWNEMVVFAQKSSPVTEEALRKSSALYQAVYAISKRLESEQTEKLNQ